jgi:hypothetical protein
MIHWTRWQQFQQALSLWQWGGLILGISAAIWLIVRLRTYFREDAEDADGTLEMLTQFRDLHQEGGLSDDEFRLIKSRLAVTARGALGAGKAKSSAILAESGSADVLRAKRLVDSERVNSTNSTTIKKNSENDVTSAWMTDEEAE